MIVAGIDIGSRGAKGVILKDGKIVIWQIGDTLADSVKTAYVTVGEMLKRTGLTLDDIEYTVATGYGRVNVPFADENISEISCHARGINFYYPQVRTILDMGGQDCKAINCDVEGRVTNFVMNDKCAGGTGRFLEMIAEVLGLPLTEIGAVALKSTSTIPFNTICAVFAKSEAITNLRKGVAKSDILAGLNDAIATRCHNLLKRVTIEKDFSITGGIAKNKGMVAKIRERVGLEPLLAEDPQIIGALGAALFAQDKLQGKDIKKGMKINYGYTDATGEYYITIDTTKCNGCAECASVCPSALLAVVDEDGTGPKAKVKDLLRKKIAILCPGFSACRSSQKSDCHRVCPQNAITHSW